MPLAAGSSLDVVKFGRTKYHRGQGGRERRSEKVEEAKGSKEEGGGRMLISVSR